MDFGEQRSGCTAPTKSSNRGRVCCGGVLEAVERTAFTAWTLAPCEYSVRAPLWGAIIRVHTCGDLAGEFVEQQQHNNLRRAASRQKDMLVVGVRCA